MVGLTVTVLRPAHSVEWTCSEDSDGADVGAVGGGDGDVVGREVGAIVGVPDDGELVGASVGASVGAGVGWAAIGMARAAAAASNYTASDVFGERGAKSGARSIT
jgi:hypothetical protein